MIHLNHVTVTLCDSLADTIILFFAISVGSTQLLHSMPDTSFPEHGLAKLWNRCGSIISEGFQLASLCTAKDNNRNSEEHSETVHRCENATILPGAQK